MKKLKYILIPVVLGGGVYGADLSINPYDETPVKYEISVNKGDEGTERVSFDKTKPEMILGKWSDEIQMKVGYNLNATGDRNLLSNKIEWEGTDESVVAYPIDEGYEFEIILKSKPKTNVFDFTITGAENLDFFYQPALTQQEIDEGAFRPDNVVGSYAVYHKTKANHRVGSINYTTGKAYHIYRPKAIDANGVEVWVDLFMNEKSGILSMTVPWDFLNTATYPVKF